MLDRRVTSGYPATRTRTRTSPVGAHQPTAQRVADWRCVSFSRLHQSRSLAAAWMIVMANPNPSPETRFGAGQPTNLGGKTAKQREAEYKAAEIAAILQLKMLSGMLESAGGEDGAALSSLSLITSDNLRLMKDAQDRAHGTPRQTVEHGGEGGGPIRHEVSARDMTDDELAAYLRK